MKHKLNICKLTGHRSVCTFRQRHTVTVKGKKTKQELTSWICERCGEEWQKVITYTEGKQKKGAK